MSEFIIERTEFIHTQILRIGECIVIIRWNDPEDRQTSKIRNESIKIVYDKIFETIQELEKWGIYPDEFSFNVSINL